MTSEAKRGSMHFYSKEHNFLGGQGIVRAQVLERTGCAFTNQYLTAPGLIACYSDHTVNQSQILESANMASLWKFFVLCVEYNHYGMACATSAI